MSVDSKLNCTSFEGECWSGEESKIVYNRDGSTKECLAQNFDPCPYNSYHCVGKAFANRVYRLKDGKYLCYGYHFEYLKKQTLMFHLLTGIVFQKLLTKFV